MAGEREARPDDDTEGQFRRLSAGEPDPAPEDDAEGAGKTRLGDTEDDAEGHKGKR
jgi:hypothetical protein